MRLVSFMKDIARCSVLAGMFLGIALSGDVLAQKGALTPLLPLESNMKSLPFLGGAFRDPVVSKASISSPQEAENLLRNLSEYQSDLSRSNGLRRNELIGQKFEAYAVLEAYLADSASGKFADNSEASGKIPQNLSETRRQLVAAAKAYVSVASSPKEKTRAEFHIAVTNYLLGANRGGSVGSLKKLIDGKDLNTSLKARAKLLIAIHAVETGDRKAASEAERTIMSLGNSVPKDGVLASRLALAKRLSRDKNKDYRKHLNVASNLAAGRSQREKDAILSFITAAWRSAEGKSNWTNPPFNLNPFESSLGAKAIRERVALGDWQEKREGAAIQKMTALKAGFSGTLRMKDFDERILTMHEILYKKSKDATAYEKALLNAKENYQDGVLGEGNEAAVQKMKQDIVNRYRRLVRGEIAEAKGVKASSKERRQAIALATRYLNFAESPTEKEEINADIAAIYVLDKQYAKAVRLYLDLAEQNASGKTKQYLELAAKSQRILAGWPDDPPWDQVKEGGKSAERGQLLDIYTKLLGLSKDHVEWRYLAHTGLLQISLGQMENAFGEWTKALHASPQVAEASLAAGYMLVTYQTSKRWQNLEDLARFCRDKGVRARHKGKTLDVNQLLADALFYGGKEALAEQKFDIAIKKLEEFTKTFPKAKNRDEGLYLLAFSYYGAARYRDAVQTMITMIEGYPASKFLRGAALTGGEWSIPMGFEENAIFFFETFLRRFGTDGEAPRIRDTLYDLYLGRGLYAEALAVLRAQASAANVSQDGKTLALQRVMRVEDKYGDSTRAVKAAETLIHQTKNSAVQAGALGVIGRSYVKSEQIASLKQIEARLLQLGTGNDEVRDNVSEIRLALAEANAKGAFEMIHNLSLTDPLNTLNQRYSKFIAVTKGFERVCELPRAAYCAPALYRVARLSEDFITSLEDISIPQALPESEVTNFEKRKRDIIGTAVKQAEEMDAKSLQMVSEGNMDPYWTTQILWQNASDWDAEHVTGEAGAAYFQWRY